MEQTQSSTQSIQDINAALLARYRESQKANTASSTSSTSFASTLDKIEKQELAAPTPLKAAQKTTAVPTSDSSSTATTADVVEEETCAAPKISRSARMACAEKATEVAYEDDEFSFDDLVDLLNPLQHIPVVGSIYRSLTGDEIKPDVQVAGSVMFGVATGSILLSAASGIASATIESQTGKEPTIQVADALFGSDTVEVGDPLTEEKIEVADASGAMAGRAATQAVEQPEAPAPAPTPKVNVAAASAAATVLPATAAVTTAIPDVKTAQAEMPAIYAGSGGMRVGHTIYTSPMMRSAGKVVTSSAATTKTANAVTTSTAQTQQATAAQPSADETLGSLIQEQAKAHESGQKLPPQLVHNMMLMAYDKYKTAQTTTSSGTTAVQ